MHKVLTFAENTYTFIATSNAEKSVSCSAKDAEMITAMPRYKPIPCFLTAVEDWLLTAVLQDDLLGRETDKLTDREED